MPQFQEKQILPHSAEFISDIILDVESYPQFLPWCSDAKIIKSISKHHFHARLAVDFKGLKESYISDVSSGKRKSDNSNQFIIEAIAINGPFKRMVSKWEIEEINEKSCFVCFSLDFEFNSFLLNKILSEVFLLASQKMMNAFKTRADFVKRGQ